MTWFDRAYIVAIALLAAVVIWAAFDIEERSRFVLLVQAPVLLMRIFWKRRSRRGS